MSKGVYVHTTLADEEQILTEGGEFKVSTFRFLLSPFPITSSRSENVLSIFLREDTLSPSPALSHKMKELLKQSINTERLYFFDIEMEQYMDRIREHYQKTGRFMGFHTDFFLQLSHHLIQYQIHILEAVTSIPFKKEHTREEILKRIEFAREMMHGKFRESVGIATFARQASLSEHHFSRMFNTIYGTPPHRFINELRLRKAKDLLLTTDQPIGDIGAEVGFSEIASFSRAYHNHFGVRPSHERAS